MSMEVGSSIAHLTPPRHSWWSIQTRKEKKLLATCAILGALVVVFFICTIAFGSKKHYKPPCYTITDNGTSGHKNGVETCTTKECIEAAFLLKTNMNEDKDPCENFYDFACGGFEAKSLLGQNSFRAAKTEMDKQITELLKTMDSDKVQNQAMQSAVYFYQECVKKGHDEDQSINSLRELINYVLGTDWPVAVGDNWNETDFNWSLSLARLLSLYDLDWVTSDTNSGMYLIIPDVEDYQNLALYLMFEALPVSIPENINDLACMIYPNCTRSHSPKKVLRSASEPQKPSSKESLLKASTGSSKLSIEDLAKNITNVDWQQFFQIWFNGTSINLKNLTFLVPDIKALKAKVEEFDTKKREFADKMGLFLVKEFGNIRSLRIKNFWPEDTTLSSTCMTFAMKHLGFAVAKLYVDKHLPKNVRSEILDLTNVLRRAFKKVIEDSTWLEAETEAAALRKLEKMKSHVALPDWVYEDEQLTAYYKDVAVEELKKTSFFSASVLVTRNVALQKLKLIGASRELFWPKSVIDVNAFNHWVTNSMYYLIGMLKNPFYSPGRCRAIKYGLIGYIAGHEITHGFDSLGRSFDENGYPQNWWDTKSTEEFVRRSTCFIDQYNKIKDEVTDLHLNGTKDLGENISDNGGIRAAYQAFLDAPEEESARLPGLEKYTEEQTFFVAAAQNWCNKLDAKQVKLLIEIDTHSPPKYRVNVPLQNFPEFSKAFNCAPETFMNPKDRCRIW